MTEPVFSRQWAMPNSSTFSIDPIAKFVSRWTAGRDIILDPFARNSKVGTITNDLSPDTSADYHMDAESFLGEMGAQGVKADALIFDPPYSPRQISECYQDIGLPVGPRDTQNAGLYRRVRDAAIPLLTDGAVVLSFGWHSNGMGIKRGFSIKEIMLVAHGGAHNDTICIAETMNGLPLWVAA